MRLEDRYQNLLKRRASQEDRQVRAFSEQFEHEEALSLRVLIGSLSAVDPRFTKMLVEQGDRVENQLATRIPADHAGVAYRRQGSVSNNTHIRFSSDVDVLAIIGDFHFLEPPQRPSAPYLGNPVDDVAELRGSCVKHLRNAFPAATVDDSRPIAIWMKGGSLRCDVDVVAASWYNTVSYSTSMSERDRGIMVLNRDRGEHISNYPFLFNYRIEQRDLAMAGLLRAQIRLLKTIAADLKVSREGEPLSSFDICSVVYRMDPGQLLQVRTFPIRLATNLLTWLSLLESSAELRGSLKVVDDSRLIFDRPEKLLGLTTLRRSLEELVTNLPAGLGNLLYESKAYL